MRFAAPSIDLQPKRVILRNFVASAALAID